MPNEPKPDGRVRDLAERRAAARAEKDFAAADALRDELVAAGWVVVDEPGGWRLESAAAGSTGRDPIVRAADVPSVLEVSATADVAIHWVCEGWPEDIARAVASFRAHSGGRDLRFVVVDTTDQPGGAFGDDVEVVRVESGTGWGAARNAGLRRSAGELVFVMDGSIEAVGDVFGPLGDTLADPTVGIAGPFGIVTKDLRQFDEQPEPGPCDAVEGYFMAMRRETLIAAGVFDEKFKWYRTADIEYSFRVKDLGLSTQVVGVPVVKHAHRMWFESDPETRARFSKRNYYRFLDRWRDRWDLVLDPQPPESHDHGPDHDHHGS
ncbi:MAG: glycosyltransferase [Actinomycetota bacterium]